jgi:hypothetical protein
VIQGEALGCIVAGAGDERGRFGMPVEHSTRGEERERQGKGGIAVAREIGIVKTARETGLRLHKARRKQEGRLRYALGWEVT